MPLYEYAVIRVFKDGDEFRDLLVPITAVVARNEEHVRKIAARAIPLSEDPDLEAAIQASLHGDDGSVGPGLDSLQDDSKKMQVMNTKADGNCGFHAVLQIMADTYAVNPNHQDLNNNLATFMVRLLRLNTMNKGFLCQLFIPFQLL